MAIRRKSNMVLLLTVTFLMFVSYKILEPDISRSPRNVLAVGDISEDYRSVKGNNSISPGESTMALRDAVIEELTRKYKLDFSYKLHESPWTAAASLVDGTSLHPIIVPELGGILNAMLTRKIVSADINSKGMQIKLTLYLEGGQRVLFKPRLYPRDHIVTGKTPYAGFDRHNGEVAAFHIGRMFEFNRTPLVVGRYIDLRKEIIPVASSRLLETFFTSDTGNNSCFYGKCVKCTKELSSVCANGNIMEGVIVLWLPSKYRLSWIIHPWRYTYKTDKQNIWQFDNSYCDTVVKKYPHYSRGPRLLDLIDTSVVDFLIGNADRHHYETLGGHPDSMVLILDNAKSFGNPYRDFLDTLAPVYQCCNIRYSTWKRLLVFQNGVFSSVLKNILNQDPLCPVLDEPHYDALTRRIDIVLTEVQKCIDKHGMDYVLIHDS